MAAARLITFFIAALALVSSTGRTAAEVGSKDWAFEPASKDELPKLVYGRTGTDDVDILLWCNAASHSVSITPVGADDERFDHVGLKSGKQTLELELHQDDLLGSVGTAPLGAPLLIAFRSSGRLYMILSPQRRLDVGARSSEGRLQIRAFFDACG